jgi:large subunit ribosomal protein L24
MFKSKINKKDTVIVTSGKDKGKKGEVLAIYPDKNRVLVSKVNIITKATKPTQSKPGGLDKKESPIHVSNVALICPKCEKPNRPKRDKLKTGERARVCRKCGEVIL